MLIISFLSYRPLLMLFNALGASYLIYCCSSYYTSLCKQDILRLSSKYIECGRTIIFCRKGVSSASVLKTLGWLNMDNFFHYHVMTYIHRCIHYPNPITQLLAPISHSHSTRSASLNYALPRIKSNRGKQSFQFFAAHAWNSLPSNIKAIPSKETFKRYLFDHIQQLQHDL